jgi:outer membrane protein assembly factor BamB
MNPTRVLALLVLAVSASASRAQDGWLVFRGDAQRTGAAAKQPAWEKPVAWQRPLLMDKLEGFPEADPDEAVDVLIKKLRKDADPTILPGSFPIIVNGSCIYRNYRGVCSAALREYSVKDEESGGVAAYRPSNIVWKTIPHNSSLATLLEKNRTKEDTAKVITMLQAEKRDCWIWANPMIGSLSSDGATVFGINDFVFPPLSELAGPPRPFVEIKVKPSSLVSANGLYAYDAENGKVLWELPDSFSAKNPPPKNSHFLGAPLPINGKLYLLNEIGGTEAVLRLVTVDFDRKKWKFGREIKVAKSLDLLTIPAAEQIVNHPLRRTQPLHIAHALERDEKKRPIDLLVCPTHAGVLFGVDRAKMTESWQYRYRAEKTAAPRLPFWQAACPIVAKDRIVFTAADARDIHCIDFNGKKKWVALDDNDLYLATVHEDVVLLVGKTHCRALALADGEEIWRTRLGQPAGVGVRDGSLYYVPIKDDPKGPSIWAIDLVIGTKVRRVNVPSPDALGNLALHRGLLVSQSVTHIAAFPLGAK